MPAFRGDFFFTIYSGSVRIVSAPIVPLASASSDRQPSARAVAPLGMRILVVDDNRDSAESLGMLLGLMGNEVRTVHDGLRAVETAEDFRPQVVLLDIGLPRLNGWDVARPLREKPWSKDMVLIALTGRAQESDRRRSRDAGFDHHLVKPVDLALLQRLLASKT
jgi:CheY-like chemotaxis protein